MRMISTLVVGVVVVIGLWFAAGQEQRGPVAVNLVVSDPPPVVLGVIPYLTVDALKAEIEPVATYLRTALHRPTRINVAADYESLGKLLDEGRVHLAWFSHASLQMVGRGKDWEAVCRPVYGTRMYYPGAIITRADSPIFVLEQLRGKRFAYVDRYSGSGFFYPNKLLVAHGIEPLSFFGSVTFTHSHDLSIEGVKAGQFDAAAVFSLIDKKTYRDRLNEFRILAYTGPIPNDPIVVRRKLDPPLKEAVRKAMLTMHVEPAGQECLKALYPLRGTTRFAGEDEVQAAIRAMGVGEVASSAALAVPTSASGPQTVVMPAASSVAAPAWAVPITTGSASGGFPVGEEHFAATQSAVASEADLGGAGGI